MLVHLNGEGRSFAAPLSVAGLLEQLGLDARLVAVELNRVVIKRAAYPQQAVHDGDEVEIVAFVGGGALADDWRPNPRGCNLNGRTPR